MVISEKNYQDNLAYVKGMFSLGGLSECGKTSAGLRLAELGVRRSKIIQIEREMMLERGYDLSDGMKDEHFVLLYATETEEVFREFLFRLIEKMKADGTQFASIESLYRAELGSFLKAELGERMANIYIDAPVEVRAYREMLKVNAKAEQEGKPPVTLEEMIEKVSKKDIFKTSHNAQKVKDIADYVVDNSDSVTKEQFMSKIDEIAFAIGVKRSEIHE